MIRLFRKKQAPPPLDAAEIEEFRRLCEDVSRLWSREGRFRGAVTETFPARLLSRPQPRRCLEMLRLYHEVLMSEFSEGQGAPDEKRLLWKMLSRLGLRPCSDLMDAIKDEDVVEVYSPEHWQIFRNSRCLDLVDMTVEEFSSFYWNRDVKRSISLRKEGLHLVFLMMTGLMRKTFHITTMPSHPVQVYGNGRIQNIEMAMRLASPLFRNGKVGGYLVTSRSCQLGS